MVFSYRFEVVDKFSTGIACSRGCSAAAELLVYYIFNLNQMDVLNVYLFTIKNFVFIVYIIFYAVLLHNSQFCTCAYFGKKRFILLLNS